MLRSILKAPTILKPTKDTRSIRILPDPMRPPSMSLQLSDARYEVDGFTPLLVVVVEGVEARILFEPKPELFSRGIVFLGDAFEGDDRFRLEVEVEGARHTL